MSPDIWVIITDGAWAGALAVAQRSGRPVTAAVVGPRDLADAVAGAGVSDVLWVEPAAGTPAEAYADELAEQVAAVQPTLLVANRTPTSRVLLGAAATRAGAAVVAGVIDVSGGEPWIVERRALADQIIETLAVPGPVAAIVGSDDATPEEPSAGPAPVTSATLTPSALTVTSTAAVGATNGLLEARTVVSFGRGVKSKADIALVERLAAALDAEIACTMPVADDLGWIDKARYVGRSGQHIAPRLYLAIGVAGAPQHMEGVRGARVVAAVNSDPEAPMFRTADYGVVGDLYEVVPELIAALQHGSGNNPRSAE